MAARRIDSRPKSLRNRASVWTASGLPALSYWFLTGGYRVSGGFGSKQGLGRRDRLEMKDLIFRVSRNIPLPFIPLP